MAKLPTPAPAKKPYEEESKEFKERLASCRAEKEKVRLDLQEGYFFTRPTLAENVSSLAAPIRSVANEDKKDELHTSLGTELSVDFATEVISGFFPANVDWVQSKAGEALSDEEWADIEDDVRARDTAIFKSIRASNFEAALALALVPDMAIGTVALMIEDYHPSQPFRVTHVPIRELELSNGRGGCDTRMAVKWVRASDIKSLLPNVDLPEKLETALKRDPKKAHALTWAWWRDWDEPADTVWYHCIAVDDEVVWSEKQRGEGSCALIVMRFLPHALSAWGYGPCIQSLPFLRVVDVATETTQDRFDIAIAPPFLYDDDGVINFEGGVEAGKGYARRPGSGPIDPLYFQGDPDVAFYTKAELEQSIRRAHFADYPEQKGDTPPTATQWVDMMVMSQRRIGTPGVAFWCEGPAEIFKRVEHLLTQRGRIAPIQSNGREVLLAPDNPATKAQEQMEVQLAVRVLEIAHTFFPETSQAAIDQVKTLENVKKKTGDRLVVLRGSAVVEELVKGMLAGAMSAAQGGNVPA